MRVGAWPISTATAYMGRSWVDIRPHREENQRTQCRIHLLTDSRDVSDTLSRALQGRPVACVQHCDLWQRVLTQKYNISRVTWVRAHLSWDEAQLRNIPRAHWFLNSEADGQATSGCNSHVEDPGALALYQYRSTRIRQWQQYLLRLYKLFRVLPKFGGLAPPRLQQRLRPQGPRRLPRTQRADTRCQAQHLLRHHHLTVGCSRCGCTSKARR